MAAAGANPNFEHIKYGNGFVTQSGILIVDEFYMKNEH
jgi:hypothetical protein